MLANCTSCGRVFAATGGRLCPECGREREAEFERVRRYLLDHPQASIEEVVEQTGVSQKRILEFIREDRLDVRPLGAATTCRFCGAPTPAGRLCERCAGSLRAQLQELAIRPSSRMYSGDRYGRRRSLPEGKQR